MRKPTLYVTIGPAACGKSTFAHAMMVSDKRLAVVSTDTILKVLHGTEASQEDPEAVFTLAYEDTKWSLRCGQDVVFDATNTTTWARDALLRAVGDIPCRKVAVCFTASLEDCLYRNENRARQVPETVIHRQYRQYMRDAPSIPRQFDEIVTV